MHSLAARTWTSTTRHGLPITPRAPRRCPPAPAVPVSAPRRRRRSSSRASAAASSSSSDAPNPQAPAAAAIDMGKLDEIRAKVSGAAAANAGGSAAPKEKTAFAKRNPVLERYVPDFLEDAVDALLPDELEARMDKGVKRAEEKIAQFKTDFNEGFGEVAGVLFKVAGYATSKFRIQDLVFGVYHLADHHKTTEAKDAVQGTSVDDPERLAALLRAAEAATMAYSPDLATLERRGGVPREDVLLFDPTTTPRRPAHVLLRDRHVPGRLVWSFRGTTDLNDILTDICAACSPYEGGHAHWGMLEAARYFAKEELPRVRAILDKEKCTQLQLVGHSLGAGTAALLAHVARNDPAAKKLMAGIDVTAVGVATPAVLSAELAEGCSDYVDSVVLLHDIVPRFSIHNVFQMKEEMDATRWGDKLAAAAADWAVPDVIERTETFQRLQKGAARKVNSAADRLATVLAALVAWLVALLRQWGLVKEETPEQQRARQLRAARAAAVSAAVEAGAAGASDVVPVYAPGRLFFLDRTDPPKEEAERLRKEQRAARDAAKKALADEAAAAAAAKGGGGKAPAATTLSSADGADAGGGDTMDDEVRRVLEQARHTLPTVDAYPGSEFSLVEGAPGERFRRIVLRETCLSDHLTGGTLQGCRQLLERARAKAA